MYNLTTYTLIYVTALYSTKLLSFFKGKVLIAACNRICVGLYIENFRERL
jgi:hypothetical protein